ncbi:MAG: UDP-N-acetylmuramate--alanine ligase [Burkholderiales bacterium]
MASHPASSQGQRNRARIAQVAARLIAEHGLTDWAAARRKACRELGFGERERLPANEEIEQALRDYNSLYQPQAQAASLRAQRLAALDWMERLAQWQPLLVGGVAAGWATEHSDVRVELEAEDPKSVELALINAGIEYTAASPQGGIASGARLHAGRGPAAVRLDIVSPQQRRNRPRRNADERLSLAELRSLVAAAADRVP